MIAVHSAQPFQQPRAITSSSSSFFAQGSDDDKDDHHHVSLVFHPSIPRSDSDLVVPAPRPWSGSGKTQEEEDNSHHRPNHHEVVGVPDSGHISHAIFRSPRRDSLLTVLWPSYEMSSSDWSDPLLVKGVIENGQRNTDTIRRNLAILRRHLYKRRIRLGAAHSAVEQAAEPLPPNGPPHHHQP